MHGRSETTLAKIGVRVLVGLVAAIIVGVGYIFLRTDSGLHSSGSKPGQKDVISGAPASEAKGWYLESESTVLDDVSALKEDVARLREALEGVERRVDAMHMALDTFNAATDYREAMVTKEDEERIDEDLHNESLMAQEELAAERDFTQSLARMQEYGSTFQAEQVDREWSSDTMTTIQNAFTDDALSATVVQDIQCRETMCRVKVAHDDPEVRRQFERTFIMTIAATLPSAVIHTDQLGDGSSRSTIYLAREGYQLPSVGGE